MPPLKNKVWADYRLTPFEWKHVKLVHHCLKVCIVILSHYYPIIKFTKLIAKRHNELSKEDSPTCTRLYPTLEMLMSDWEELLENDAFEPVHSALRAGIALLEKSYRRADDTKAYFISHSKSSAPLIVIEFNFHSNNEHIVLDPVTKIVYLEAAWQEKDVEIGKKCLKEEVSLHVTYDYLYLIVSFSFLYIRPGMKLC